MQYTLFLPWMHAYIPDCVVVRFTPFQPTLYSSPFPPLNITLNDSRISELHKASSNSRVTPAAAAVDLFHEFSVTGKQRKGRTTARVARDKTLAWSDPATARRTWESILIALFHFHFFSHLRTRIHAPSSFSLSLFFSRNSDVWRVLSCRYARVRAGEKFIVESVTIKASEVLLRAWDAKVTTVGKGYLKKIDAITLFFICN